MPVRETTPEPSAPLRAALLWGTLLLLVGLAVIWAGPALVRQRAAESAVVTLLFAAGAWLSRGATLSGALAGYCIAFVIYLAGSRRAFAAVFAVFAVTWICTRLRYAHKQRLGTAERKTGRRAGQVFANLGIAAAMFTLSLNVAWPAAALIAGLAALAEAAADTCASEVGQAFSKVAYRITDLQPVAPGSHGGISLAGTLAGIAAAAVVLGTAVLVQLVDAGHAALAGLGALAGMFFDSLLGATLETRGWLNNEAVNLLGTGAAAALALLLVVL